MENFRVKICNYPFNGKHLSDVERENGDIPGVVSPPHQVGRHLQRVRRLEQIRARLVLGTDGIWTGVLHKKEAVPHTPENDSKISMGVLQIKNGKSTR